MPYLEEQTNVKSQIDGNKGTNKYYRAYAEVQKSNVKSRETILRTYIEQQKDRYDYILIDCMPSLGMITINAFASADSILIPVQAAYLPVKGLEQLIKTIGSRR